MYSKCSGSHIALFYSTWTLKALYNHTSIYFYIQVLSISHSHSNEHNGSNSGSPRFSILPKDTLAG